MILHLLSPMKELTHTNVGVCLDSGCRSWLITLPNLQTPQQARANVDKEAKVEYTWWVSLKKDPDFSPPPHLCFVLVRYIYYYPISNFISTTAKRCRWIMTGHGLLVTVFCSLYIMHISPHPSPITRFCVEMYSTPSLPSPMLPPPLFTGRNLENKITE